MREALGALTAWRSGIALTASHPQGYGRFAVKHNTTACGHSQVKPIRVFRKNYRLAPAGQASAGYPR